MENNNKETFLELFLKFKNKIKQMIENEDYEEFDKLVRLGELTLDDDESYNLDDYSFFMSIFPKDFWEKQQEKNLLDNESN